MYQLIYYRLTYIIRKFHHLRSILCMVKLFLCKSNILRSFNIINIYFFKSKYRIISSISYFKPHLRYITISNFRWTFYITYIVSIYLNSFWKSSLNICSMNRISIICIHSCSRNISTFFCTSYIRIRRICCINIYIMNVIVRSFIRRSIPEIIQYLRICICC